MLSFTIDNEARHGLADAENVPDLVETSLHAGEAMDAGVTAVRFHGVAAPSIGRRRPVQRLRRAAARSCPVPHRHRPLSRRVPSGQPLETASTVMNSMTIVSEADDDAPAGMALISGEGLRRGRVYMCDPANHVVDVVDDAARPLFSFGGYGTGPGQFDTPVDLAIVPLTGDAALSSVADAVLVIADRGNHRVQLLTLDGVWIATIDDATSGPASGWPVRTGWPYFHTGIKPCVRFPSRLRWSGPFLDIASSIGGTVRIDLPVVLLPSFDDWLRQASRPVLRDAHLELSARPSGAVPEWCLHRILRRLRGRTRVDAASQTRVDAVRGEAR